MIASMMLYSLLIGLVLALGCWSADRLARRAGVAQRFVWFGALATLSALTLSSPWRRTSATVVELPVAVSASTESALTAAPDAFPWLALLNRFWDGFQTYVAMVASLFADVVSSVSADINFVIGAAWFLLSTSLLVVLLFTLRRLDAQRRGFPRAQLQGIQVRVGAIRGPAVYGVLTPEIVVPSALLARSSEEQQLALAHEDEHRRARDPLLLALTAVLVALLPWHPFAWWCAARLRLATELDCDARVLRRGTSARRYGALLLAVADTMSSAPRTRHALALLDSRRHLERRILAMTTRPTRRAPLALTALSLVGAGAIFAACSTDVPTAAQVRDADATTVVRQLGLPSGEGQIVYFVDGKQMADAETVPAEKIASIEVRRKSEAGEVSQVHIHTIDAESADEAEARRGTSTAGITSDTLLTLGRTRYLGEEQARASRDSTRAVARQVVERLEAVRSARDKQVRSVSNMRFAADSMRVAADSLVLIGDTITYLNKTVTGRDSVVIKGRWYDPDGDGVAQTRSARTRYTEPLVIIDGVIMTDRAAMNRINPNNIESIEVLKGEAAVKIHGARAAAGVIQIKTKP